MTTAEFFLDAGQSAVKIRSVAGTQRRTLSFSRVDTSKAIAPQIVFAIHQFVEQTGTRPSRIAVSSTALSDPHRTAEEMMRGVRDLGAQSILVAHDSVGGFLGALGHDHGAVAAVGTGVVTLGVGPQGFARVDGWGNIIGDAGSGYWIGRKALDHALRAYDGRGPETVLLSIMRDHFEDVETAYLELQADPDRIFRVASFAKPTTEAAATDAVARVIVEQACTEIIVAVEAALRRVGFSRSDTPAVSWTGSVAANPLVSSLLERLLHEAWPGAVVHAPHGEPLDGVEKMVSLPSDHPLVHQVVTVYAS